MPVSASITQSDLMKRLLSPFLLLTLLAAILTACSNISRVISTGLDVEIISIERTGEGTAAVSWHVKNSNVVPYLLSHVNHKIQLNGTELGVIDEKEALAVPTNSNAGRTSKLTGLSAAASRVLSEAVASGSASYHIDSQITILIYDDSIEKATLTNSGTVSVKAK